MPDSITNRFDRIDSTQPTTPTRKRTVTATPTSSEPRTDVDLHRASGAVYLAFVANGGLFAAWASRIPDAIRQLEVSTAQFSLLLLCLSIGAVAALPLSGLIVQRIGLSRAILTGASVASVGVSVAALGVTVWALPTVVAVGLAFTGLGMGLWDASMNMAGADVEHRLGRSIMPRYHAAFSGGTVASALIGAAASAARIPLAVHIPALVVVLLVAVVIGTRPLRGLRHRVEPRPDDTTPVVTRSAWTERRTLLIGVVVMVAAFTEGTANDWIAEAFVSGHGVPSWAGILAFAVFLTCMTAGRLVGTHVLDRYGRVPVLRITMVAAVLGCLLVVFGPTPVAYLGVAVWGMGVALGFPVGMSAAADDPDRAPARVATVSTIGYTAFLAGPPLLGFLGEHFGVLRALLVVGAAVIVALACLPAVREPARRDLSSSPRHPS
ncbi:MFS transporter [Enemella evansiae]|nr:MFS transporter [Enemella evansiae]OYO03219.1 MFS transporter [Enemella evansiae]